MHGVPERLARTIAEVHQAAGVAWLNNLPTLLAAYAERWSITLQPPFDGLSYNYVAPGVRADGLPVVLKAGVPNRELTTEIAALQLYDGHGIVRLLAADPAGGALLLERLLPGTPLAELPDDEQATTIASSVMRQLWRPVPADHPFPTVTDWASGLRKMRAHFGGTTGPFPPTQVERAETLFAELIDSQAEPVLLHGDLHHHNIVTAQRESWLAIDPKGLVGEPAYEVGALLRNPMPEILSMPQPTRVLERRVDQLAEALQLDRSRLIGWSFAQAVLSAWWSYEDHGHGWELALAFAELLRNVR